MPSGKYLRVSKKKPVKCLTCSKEFIKKSSAKGLYCSHSCYSKTKVGKAVFIGGHTGKKHSKEWKLEMSLKHKGKNLNGLTNKEHPQWKGGEANYRSIHAWVTRWKGKSELCEGCGKDGLKGKEIHWANIDHKYRRVLEDYIRLCRSCHLNYDLTLKK